MAETKNDKQEDIDKIDWIVPPGLSESVDDFKKLYDNLYSPSAIKKAKKPLMICGDTGVGKSMFVHIFKEKYKKNDKKNIRVNVAAFNKELIESELFGHVVGAYTGASTQRDGFLKKADKGLLILEEIGDLPKSVQAKLLTFLEDGYFYPVGSEKEEYADVQIVATTNKPKKKFRADLWSRFFQFYVPAIYQYRIDVLYHIYNIDKDILLSLTTAEVMTFLSYNGQGNVREIENICFLMRWQDEYRYNPKEKDSIFGILSEFDKSDSDNKYCPFNIFETSLKLQKKLNNYNINSHDLESFLESRGFSIFPLPSVLAFSESTKVESSKDKDINNLTYMTCEDFNNYDDRLYEFCIMFCQLGAIPGFSYYNINLLDINEVDLELPLPKSQENLQCYIFTAEDNVLREQIRNFRIGTKMKNHAVVDVNSMPENEFDSYIDNLRYNRYKKCLNETGGNITKAAEKLGIKYRTLQSRLNKYSDLSHPNKDDN